MEKPKYIYIFGDSISWGAWDMEKGGWVNRLWLYVAKRKKEKNYTRIYNRSITTGTTGTILKRFENELRNKKSDTIIFKIGFNDASYDKPGNFMVQPAKFKKNISEIIKRAKKIAIRVIFLSLGNCDESKTMPESWNNIYYYTNKNIKKYNNIIKELCHDNKVIFLDVGLLNNKDFDDGFHPNAKGHEKIFKKVKNFMIKNKWI